MGQRKMRQTFLFMHDEDTCYVVECYIEEGVDLVQALRDASAEYLRTKEGMDYLKYYSCGCFNFGDAVGIPEEITLKHGFKTPGDIIEENFGVDMNEHLVPADVHALLDEKT